MHNVNVVFFKQVSHTEQYFKSSKDSFYTLLLKHPTNGLLIVAVLKWERRYSTNIKHSFITHPFCLGLKCRDQTQHWEFVSVPMLYLCIVHPKREKIWRVIGMQGIFQTMYSLCQSIISVFLKRPLPDRQVWCEQPESGNCCETASLTS